MNDTIIVDGVKYKRVEEEAHKPATKYKVGDWVRVIANKTDVQEKNSYIGDIAEITRVYNICDYQRIVNGKFVHAYNIGKIFVVFEDELEPAEEPEQNPFDIQNGDKYYWIDLAEEIRTGIKDNELDLCIEFANACKDKKLMEQRALHEILNRLLWRASIEAGELKNSWDDNKHYYIAYQLNLGGDWIIDSHENIVANQIYFPSKESAQSAIDNIVKPFVKEHPDFVW